MSVLAMMRAQHTQKCVRWLFSVLISRCTYTFCAIGIEHMHTNRFTILLFILYLCDCCAIVSACFISLPRTGETAKKSQCWWQAICNNRTSKYAKDILSINTSMNFFTYVIYSLCAMRNSGEWCECMPIYSDHIISSSHTSVWKILSKYKRKIEIKSKCRH